MDLNLMNSDSKTVTFSKLRKSYFYVLSRRYPEDIRNMNDVMVYAERVTGYTTVARYDGAEIALGVSKTENRYRVFDIASGMLISTLDDIEICRSLGAVEKLLPTVVKRYIVFMETHHKAMDRYITSHQPRMACELVIADAEAEYKCFYNQYATLITDWMKEDMLDGSSRFIQSA